MLGSIGKISKGKESAPFLTYIKQMTGSTGREHEVGKPVEESKSIIDQVDIKNINFDPHLHSSLSDGITMHPALGLGSKLDLDGMAFADHHRDDLDDVILYNDDAYRIVHLKGDDRISANMDVVYDVVREQQNSFIKEDIGSEDNLDRFVRDYNRAHEESLDFTEASKLLNELSEQTNRNSIDLFRSIERDYESWNDQKTEEFFDRNEFDHIILSTHYIPEKFVEGNPHPKQTQYLRKADLEHLNCLTDQNVEDVFDWYMEETKAKLLRSADLTELSDKAAEELYESHGVEPYRDIEELKRPIAGDTPVIHSHWDLVLTSPHLRPYVEEEHTDEYLDLAEELDEVVEVNGRTIMKQRKTYTSDDNFYAAEDAEWFARKVIDRAENDNLDYSIASDAHSETEMIEQYAMLDSILEDYDTGPLGLDIYDRTPSLAIEDEQENEPLEPLL